MSPLGQILRTWRNRYLRRRHLRLGRLGEDAACRILENQGAEILERNYRSHHQELDIVARDENGLLRFVEVKTRRYKEGVHPIDAVDAEKRRALRLAARAYLRELSAPELPHCFDVMEIFVNNRLKVLGANYWQHAFAEKNA